MSDNESAKVNAQEDSPFGEFAPVASQLWAKKETARFRPEFLRMIEHLWRDRRMVGTQLHTDAFCLTAPDDATAKAWSVEIQAAGATIPNVSVTVRYVKETIEKDGKVTDTGRVQVHFRPKRKRGVDINDVKPTVAEQRQNAVLTA